jgi:hypothetical protein
MLSPYSRTILLFETISDSPSKQTPWYVPSRRYVEPGSDFFILQ